jgi:hypothetical protein
MERQRKEDNGMSKMQKGRKIHTMNKESKILMVMAIATALIVSTIGIATVDVFAHSDERQSEQSKYDSGWDHGCDDAYLYPEDRYINQPGKGYEDHSEAFNVGYGDGFFSCGGEDIMNTQNDASAAASSSSEAINENDIENDNENANTNANSQEQTTNIYICNDGECKKQQ